MRDIKEILEKYKNFDFTKEFNYRVLNSKRKEFSRGGLMYALGIHHPSLIDNFIITNCNFGKKIKYPRKSPDFTYYFDENDKLVLVDKKDTSVSFILYESNIMRVLIFEDLKSSPKIVACYECMYDELSRIIYFLEMSGGYNLEHFYSYANLDKVEVEERITTIYRLNNPKIRKHYVPMNDFIKIMHK